MHKRHNAFTIIELLIVLVIISILATLTIVAYSGITSKANTASLQATLTNNKKLLTNYYNTYGSYPTTLVSNCPTAPQSDPAYCLKAPANTTLNYSATAQSFSLHATQGSTTYKITDSPGISSIPVTLTCPVGFIVVPGSTTYGTSDFCVMKYEAKADDNGDGVGDTNGNIGNNTWSNYNYPISTSRKITSTPKGYSISYISQANAITAANSANNMVYGCPSGCHLITEAEWMTIAQNVLSNPINWSSGSVGSGYIYSGHTDNSPSRALEADASDNNGYYDTGSYSGNQLRTLTLTNGEVIWDFSGNMLELTSGQVAGNSQPSPTGYALREWTAVSGGTFSVNPYPSGTGLPGANSWTSTNGIGRITSSSGETAATLLARGGAYNWHPGGLLAVNMGVYPTATDMVLGFRAAK